MTFGPSAENKGKKLWIFAETYVSPICNACGHCKTFRRCFENVWGVPKHQAFIQLLCFKPIAKVHIQAALNSTNPCADWVCTWVCRVQSSFHVNWEGEPWWGIPTPHWEPASLRLVKSSSKKHSQAVVTAAQLRCFGLLECF